MLRLALARLRARGRLAVSGRPRLGRGVRFDLAPGAVVSLADGCRIGARCRFHIGAGAAVAIGPDARLGERCVIAAHERIEIGPGARLEDEVVLIDFDHDIDDVERPVREQRLVTARAGAGALRGCARARPPAPVAMRGANCITEGRESAAAPGRAAPSVLVWCCRTTPSQHRPG
jgi:hypothetical protein